MVLVIVVAVLAVSYASSLRAYLHQRSHLTDLQSRIEASRVAIDDLEREKRAYDDPAYIEQQARERIGMTMPGERTFVVVQDGEPLEVESSLGDPAAPATTPPAWWESAWESMLVAGDPPERSDPLPQTLVTDPDGAPEE